MAKHQHKTPAQQDYMRDKRDQRIAAAYDLHNSDDVSTPRLLHMVADDCDCDIGRVISAMVRLGRFQPADANGEQG
jgi:hypothetical protein